MPIISIIVPVYNVEKYLPQCIESIIRQSYIDWELLLIDDGSIDQTSSICDYYSKLDERILTFHKKNGGVSSARNLGLEKSKGEWVTFIDGDDFISPSFLEGLIKPTLNNCNLDFIHGGCLNWRGGKVSEINQEYEDYVGTDPGILFEKFRGLAVSKLFRLINIRGNKEHPLEFDSKMKIAEDMAFTLDYLMTVKKYSFVSEKGYYYRKDNVGSATNKITIYPYDMMLHSFKHLYKSTCNFIKINGIGFNQSYVRLEQRGRQLQQTVISLYLNENKKSFRLKALCNDFSEQEFALLRYAKTNIMKKALFSLLRNKYFVVFDFLMSLIIRIKK